MKNIKTFESFLNGEKVENLSKMDYAGEVDQKTKNDILNVDNFNTWLSEDYYGGSAGLIGRIDKLSNSMITSYFTDKGVECNEREIYDFIQKIRTEWLKNKN